MAAQVSSRGGAGGACSGALGGGAPGVEPRVVEPRRRFGLENGVSHRLGWSCLRMLSRRQDLSWAHRWGGACALLRERRVAVRSRRRPWWLSELIVHALTGAHTHPRRGHAPDLVSLPPPLPFPSCTSPALRPRPSPAGSGRVSHLLLTLQLCPPHIVPRVTAEPQRPAKAEEPKAARDLDQESVRVWGGRGTGQRP